jgi:hypothetical protein
MDRPKTKKQRKLARLADQAQDIANKERLARPIDAGRDTLQHLDRLTGFNNTNF